MCFAEITCFLLRFGFLGTPTVLWEMMDEPNVDPVM